MSPSIRTAGSYPTLLQNCPGGENPGREAYLNEATGRLGEVAGGYGAQSTPSQFAFSPSLLLKAAISVSLTDGLPLVPFCLIIEM